MGVDRTYVRASVFDSFPIELMAGIAVRWQLNGKQVKSTSSGTPYISVAVVARALIMPLVTHHPRVVRPCSSSGDGSDEGIGEGKDTGGRLGSVRSRSG